MLGYLKKVGRALMVPVATATSGSDINGGPLLA